MLISQELKKTRFHQDFEDEMLLRAVPMLVEAGIPIETIAERLKVTPKKVRWAVQAATE